MFDIAELLKMLGTTLGVALAAIIVAIAALWKAKSREHWLRAISPLALAAGFVAGYAVTLDRPSSWNDDAWKSTIYLAALAGVLLAIAQAFPARGAWKAASAATLGIAIGVVTMYTVSRFVPEQKTYFFGALAGWLVAVHLSARPAMREPKLWAIAPLIMLPCGFAAAFVAKAWVDHRISLTMIMLTSLAGLALVAGILRISRPIAAGAGGFLAMLFGVIWTYIAYYNESTIPLWAFAMLAAAPLALAVAWIPALKKRPRLCTAISLALALAILIPALVIIKKYAPPIEGPAEESM